MASRAPIAICASVLFCLHCGSSDSNDAPTVSADGRPASGGNTQASAGSTASPGGTTNGGGSSAGGAPPVTPDTFWDASDIPVAKNVMMFKFLNRTNGAYADTEVYWRFQTDSIDELHSIAEQPTYDMPANSSGRMYFFICAKDDASCAADPSKSPYYDFIEHTISSDRYNGNTTRVDAFGLKIALKIHAADGTEESVGEDYPTFVEDRATTFQQFIDAVPDEFKACAQPPNAPYRIVQPGAAGFDKGGAHDTYYQSFVDQLWAANGITIGKPGPNGSGLAAYPDLSAAIYRHVGATAGTFDANGKLLTPDIWKDPSAFYTAAPADYYAKFWHDRGIDGKAYGFPYDDVGSYSTYLSKQNPQYLLVAIGF